MVANRIVMVRDPGDHGSIVRHFDIASGAEVSPAVGSNGAAALGTNDQRECWTGPAGHGDPALPTRQSHLLSPVFAPTGIDHFGDYR